MPRTRQPQLLTVPDLVRRWKVSASYVRREARVGNLACVRFGRALRFTEEAAVDYENRHSTLDEAVVVAYENHSTILDEATAGAA